ncbi:hypothetical protein CROQUDRAFT_647504 [Cronartium quercuum f. sp. fusiforme G11]|uniref:Uncharacterized protein n=1 Tax=Cronartium quercuum f. sp. fusiforme G11 TaxID=708437 RepID=A0A9P6T9A4_9BASI|nr:hypothetical protein CROQUDRAFT_647504 [Cronartium quercuum f. sp. fusiforme G11]
MQISAGPSVPDEVLTCPSKELGPPTPTSFKSHPACPASPRTSRAEERSAPISVLLSGLRPSINSGLIQSTFWQATRPRPFRLFEPSHISFGVLDSGRACLLRFEDPCTAKNFCRVVIDNAPFQPMDAKLVDTEVRLCIYV